MRRPRFVEIDGKRHAWKDIVAAYRAQATAATVHQPTLFELREDHRPPGERSAAQRYMEPSLFADLKP